MQNRVRVLFAILFATAFLQTAAAAVITLPGPTSGQVGHTGRTDYFYLSGGSVDVGAYQQGGLFFAPVFNVPIGSEIDFFPESVDTQYGQFIGFSGEPEYGGIGGILTTPMTGSVYALFQASITTSTLVKGYVPAGGATLTVPATLTGTLTACVTPVGYLHICDQSAPNTFVIPVDLPGQFTLAFDYHADSNTVSYNNADSDNWSSLAVVTPEPETFVLVLCSLAITATVRRRRSHPVKPVWKHLIPSVAIAKATASLK